jgi:hypothetical protein
VRLHLPRLTWRAGMRIAAALSRQYLEPQESFDRVDLDLAESTRADVITYETEVEGTVPLGKGDIVGLASVSYLTNIPEGFWAFEETLRLIVDPPWVWRGRVGYLRRFGTVDQHSAGIVVEAFGVPGREEGLTMRAGPVVRIVLSRRVEVRGSFVATFHSPDQLGLAGSDFTELGLRYRWASE